METRGNMVSRTVWLVWGRGQAGLEGGERSEVVLLLLWSKSGLRCPAMPPRCVRGSS